MKTVNVATQPYWDFLDVVAAHPIEAYCAFAAFVAIALIKGWMV